MVSPGVPLEEVEEFTRALLGRLSAGQTLEAQTRLLSAGVQATRNLLALRDQGHHVSQETIDFAFDELEQACTRMVELMPNDERCR